MKKRMRRGRRAIPPTFLVHQREGKPKKLPRSGELRKILRVQEESGKELSKVKIPVGTEPSFIFRV